MNNRMLIFMIGFACGFAGGYFLLKDKFQQMADEEIASVKEAYKEKAEKKEEEPVKEVHHQVPDKPDLNMYMADKITKENGYRDYSTQPASNGTDKSLFNEDPYFIEGEELGETDNEVIELTYYSDGVLADDMDDIVDDAEEKVGNEFDDHFENDEVCVRNDILSIDYKITRDDRTYEQVSGLKPTRRVEA